MIDTTTGSMQLSHKLELTPKHYPGMSRGHFFKSHEIISSQMMSQLPLVGQSLHSAKYEKFYILHLFFGMLYYEKVFFLNKS